MSQPSHRSQADAVISETAARRIAWTAVLLAVVTWLQVVPFDATGPQRAVLGFLFVSLAPGVCLLLVGGVRQLTVLLLVGAATSLSIAALLSVALMFARVWSMGLAVTVIAAVTLVAAFTVLRPRPADRLPVASVGASQGTR